MSAIGIEKANWITVTAAAGAGGEAGKDVILGITASNARIHVLKTGSFSISEQREKSS